MKHPCTTVRYQTLLGYDHAGCISSFIVSKRAKYLNHVFGYPGVCGLSFLFHCCYDWCGPAPWTLCVLLHEVFLKCKAETYSEREIARSGAFHLQILTNEYTSHTASDKLVHSQLQPWPHQAWRLSEKEAAMASQMFAEDLE